MKKITLVFLSFLISVTAFSQPFIDLKNTSSTSVLYALSFASDSVGLAVGTGGEILRTVNGGTTWTKSSSGGVTELREVTFTDATTAYAVGLNGLILKSVNAGSTWSPLTSGTSEHLFGLSKIGNDIYVDGPNGTMLKSSDAGANWTPLTTGTGLNLYGNHFPDANTGYVVGNSGVMLKTIDAGAHWNTLTSGTSMQLVSVFFTDVNTGFAVGGNTGTNTGVIMKTTDGGAHWTTTTIPNLYFGKVKFLDANTGFVVGGSVIGNTSSIYKTTDGGVHWELQLSNSSRQVGVFAPSFNVAFTCGLDGTILKTTGIAPCSSHSSDTTHVVVYDTIHVPITDTLMININLLGINLPNLGYIKVYPNPARDHIYITNDNFALFSGYSLKIINSLSQEVYTGLINQQSIFIDISAWSGKGLYVVYILDANNNTVDVGKIVLK